VKNLLAENLQVVLNLGGVSYIDSGGLGTLVGLYTSAKAAGGNVKLANLTQRVRDQLVLTKLVTVFEFFDSEEQAVASFAPAARLSATRGHSDIDLDCFDRLHRALLSTIRGLLATPGRLLGHQCFSSCG
jgi:hypothetical protein